MARKDEALHAPGRFLLDCSLSLINQTGAHFIAREVSDVFAERALVRRWRLFGASLPSGVTRKLLGRLMLKELAWGQDSLWARWPEPTPSVRRLFLDPLYVLRSELERSDLVLCHDVGPLTHPSLYDPTTRRLYAKAYARIQRVSPGMVFVSHASRRAFEQLFASGYRRMEVIPLYLRSGSIHGTEKAVPGIQQPFFLTIGALEQRKNQLRALQAFAQTGLATRGYHYVLCGARGDAASEVADLVDRTPGAHLLGYVTDEQLRWLYRNAVGFVLPSLLEGFGMPALEAASYGLVPLLSRDSALTEATGGLGLSVDPLSVPDIARGLLELADMPAARRQQLQRDLLTHSAEWTQERFRTSWLDLVTRDLLPAEATHGSPGLPCNEGN